MNSIAANIAQSGAKHDLPLSILCEILLLLHTTSVNKVKKYRCMSILLRQTSGCNLFDGFSIRISIVTRKFYWDSKQIRPILKSEALHRWKLDSTFVSFYFVVHSARLSAEIKPIFTARKRSLRRLCFYTCLSVILFTGGVPGPGGAWSRGVCEPGPGWGCLVPGGGGDPRDGYCFGRYASYWNAFLFIFIFQIGSRLSNLNQSHTGSEVRFLKSALVFSASHFGKDVHGSPKYFLVNS